MPNNDNDSTPFTLPCGDVAGRVHYDDDDVPYLSVVDEHGNIWHINDGSVICACGGAGEWTPNKHRLIKMLRAYRRGRDAEKRARAELEGGK